MSDPVDLDLDRSWTYGADVQHGGRLLELVTQAGLELLDHPHPLAVSAHFLAAPRLGAATVEREVLRAGRSVSTVHVRLVRGRTCLDAVVTAGRLGAPAPPAYATGAPPALPPVGQCLRNTPAGGLPSSGLTDRIDVRLDPAAAGWLTAPSGIAEIRGYLRYADGRAPDPLALVCLADALPPVTASLGSPAGRLPSSSPCTYGRCRRLAGCGWYSGPSWSRTAGSTRPARSGTAGTASSPRVISWPATAPDPPLVGR